MVSALLGGISLAGALCGAYAVGWERHWIEVTRRDVPLEGLPERFAGVTIAHLTDIHHGPYVSLSYIRRVVALVNSLAPDLIALTGDYVDHRPQEIEPVVQVLSQLHAPLGVWAVLGGHDLRASERLCRHAFAESGIRLLRDEAAPVADGALWIAGLRDNSEYYLDNMDRALASVPAGARTLLLAHSPDSIREAAPRGVDFMLSGHTHGGQICAPFYGPIVTESRYWRQYARGLRRAGNTWVYTSRGLGVVRLPMRFLCRPELALHRLVPAPVADTEWDCDATTISAC